jgi:hypothetical protein
MENLNLFIVIFREIISPLTQFEIKNLLSVDGPIL